MTAGSQKDDAATALGSAVRVRGLTVRVGSQVLLQDTDADFAAGEITLVVGCSGTGKSVLLRILAGLIAQQETDIHFEGEIKIGDQRRLRHPVGVVFQHFALFDELAPLNNVRFAHAHRPPTATGDSASPLELLNELRVPTATRTSALSGGQRQRLAIARTLAAAPEVILFDEPTSGLDAVTAAEVASLIQRTHAAHPQTSVIVTHDFEALAPIADRILLLDAQTQSLREIPKEQWSRLREFLVPVSRESASASAEGPPESPLAIGLRRAADRLKSAAAHFLAATTRAVEETCLLPLSLLPIWKHPLWGLRFVVHYLRLVAGASAWFYVALAGIIIGFVTTYFTFRFLPYAKYTEPLLIEDLLMSMGFSLYRILVPILATILIAARCGAAVASDVGGKRYGQQIDAFRTLGARPRFYLLTPILYSFLLGTPLLTAVSYFAASTTSLIVFTATHPDRGPDFWHLHFHRELLTAGSTVFHGFWWLLSKTLLCAAGIGLIAYRQGLRPKQSSRDVSTAITSTVLWSTLLVLVVHFIFAFVEFE